MMAIALVIAVVWPTLANSRVRADRLVCLSNLGEIGKGYNLWASDHGGLYPFLVPQELGGIRMPFNGMQVNAWFQFAWISNELSSARILACPSDSNRRPAQGFSPNLGDLLHPNYRNNAISYFLSWASFPVGHPVLSGDRNVIADSYGRLSSIFGGGAAASISFSPTSRAAWDSSIHQESGNLLFRDGSVHQTGNFELRRFTSGFDSGNGHLELLYP